MEKILKKSYKILGLTALIFIFSLILFIRGMDKSFGKPAKLSLSPLSFLKMAGFPVSQPSIPAESLDPGKFRHFTYNPKGDKIITVEGECKDSFYTILFFPEKIDYRDNPAGSQYNTAFPCPSKGKFSQEINLRNANLRAGKYYIIRAGQGETGSWHNPY